MYIPKMIAALVLVLQSFLSVSVVDLSPLVVLQHLVGIVDVVELCDCVGVVRVLVWVVLDRQLPVGLLDLTGGGRL